MTLPPAILPEADRLICDVDPTKSAIMLVPLVSRIDAPA
jgi:hypothetical protein